MRAETVERFGVAEAALHDLVDDNRLVVGHMRALAEAGARVEARVSAPPSHVAKPEAE